MHIKAATQQFDGNRPNVTHQCDNLTEISGRNDYSEVSLFETKSKSAKKGKKVTG